MTTTLPWTRSTAYDDAHRLIATGRWKLDAFTGRVFDTITGRQLGGPNEKGYWRVNVPGVGRLIYLHRLVLEVFHGPIGDGLTANHRDGVKGNNSIRNLEIVTIADNLAHARKIGLLRDTGHFNSRSAFDCADVAEIRRLYFECGLSQQAIGQRYGVAQTTIGKITRGERYTDCGRGSVKVARS